MESVRWAWARSGVREEGRVPAEAGWAM